MTTPRVAVLCDFGAEGWPSIDLVGDMLVEQLRHDPRRAVEPTQIRPQMVPRLGRLPMLRGWRTAVNADRLLNRFWDYPRLVRHIGGRFDLFHLVDHSYGQLVRYLPADRTVVTCHDLDTFRCVLDPKRNPRSRAFRLMVERVLDGVRRATRVTCDSAATRDELLAFRLVPSERVSVAHLGTDPRCSPHPEPAGDATAARLLGPITADAPELLHVGSTIARKRIDVLLRVVAAVRRHWPQARLVRAGGPFTDAQARLARDLGVHDAISVLPFLPKPVLAAVYRRAALALQPSSAEGFGLPVIEAMACGTPVLASDIPALREVGGEAATYRAVDDVPGWSASVIELLAERRACPERWAARRAAGIAHAARFTWAEYARRMVEVYREVLAS